MTQDPQTDAGVFARLTAQAGPQRLALIGESHQRLLGRPLADGESASAEALWAAPMVILAHGTQSDPLFFYGNRQALALFELTADQLSGLPSRLSAQPDSRQDRARLLDQVARQGFIEDYAGVRVSRTGRLFRIEAATVWNLIDAQGRLHGQAAAFSRWTPLP